MKFRATRIRAERGVTLLELIIAISLVGLISGGMLTAMRTSLMTNEKVTARLRSNREQMSLRQMIARQIGGAMPVMGLCPSANGGGSEVPFFQGTPQTLRFVSSFSMTEGSRGYPQIVEYRVAPSTGGGFRLIANERPYTGPASTAPSCQNGAILPVVGAESSIVMANHLARCQFHYQQPIQQIAFGELQWITEWNQTVLPKTVRIEMVPVAAASSNLPASDVFVNLHADRDFRGGFVDR